MAKKKSKKSLIAPLIFLNVVLVVLLGIVFFNQSPVGTDTVLQQVSPFDFGNQKIPLNNQTLTFIDGNYNNTNSVYGLHQASISNQSVNPKGTRAAAILTDKPGGSGTFFYVVGAMLEDGHETYSTPVFLGDRIKIISVSVDDLGSEDNGIITVTFLGFPADAPLSAEPTEEMTAKYAFQDNGNLIEVLH